jgi:hypothetical protein
MFVTKCLHEDVLGCEFLILKKYSYALCLHSDAILVIFSIVKHGLCNVHIWLAAS